MLDLSGGNQRVRLHRGRAPSLDPRGATSTRTEECLTSASGPRSREHAVICRDARVDVCGTYLAAVRRARAAMPPAKNQFVFGRAQPPNVHRRCTSPSRPTVSDGRLSHTTGQMPRRFAASPSTVRSGRSPTPAALLAVVPCRPWSSALAAQAADALIPSRCRRGRRTGRCRWHHVGLSGVRDRLAAARVQSERRVVVGHQPRACDDAKDPAVIPNTNS